MSEEIVQYRNKVLEMLSRYTQQDDGLKLSTKIGTIVHYTNQMLEKAETNEDFQACAETINDIREFTEENNLQEFNNFLIGCDVELLKKYLDPNIIKNSNYEFIDKIVWNIYNNQSYGLEALRYQIENNDKFTDTLVQSLINGCKKEQDFQSLLEGIQSIEAKTPEAKEKIKSIKEKVREEMYGKTQKNVSDNSVAYSDYIKRTLPSIYEKLTTPQNGGYDLDEVIQIKGILRNIDDFLLSDGKSCFSQGELNQVIHTLNKCMIEANGIIKFFEAFQDGIHLDWTNWRNRIDQYPAMSSALLATEGVVRTGEINRQAAIIKDLARNRENQIQRNEGGRT